MPGFGIASYPTVKIVGGTATDAVMVTFISTPSGSTLQRSVSDPDFQADRGKALIDSLSDAVEQILGEGIAIAATGSQGIDPSDFIFDAVTFTVGYTPPNGAPNALTATVEIPVTTLTADTQFGSLLQGGSPAEIIRGTYAKLQELAGG